MYEDEAIKATAVNDIRTGNSDLEKFLKMLIKFCQKAKSALLSEYARAGREHSELYTLFKEEYKLMSQHWTDASNEINAYDELELSKLRMRLLGHNENNIFELEHLIKPAQVNVLFQHHTEQERSSKKMLTKRLGQLLFLKNSFRVCLIFIFPIF